MSFVRKTYEQILQEMLDRVPDDLDKREGSVIYDAVAPTAYQHYIEQSSYQDIMEQSFALTAEGEYLDKEAEDYGLVRTPPTYAKVSVSFTGSLGQVIPQGTQVANLNELDLIFTVDTDLVIGDSGTVSGWATCTIPGVRGNILSGHINHLVSAVSNITYLTNTAAGSGGQEAESDESLRARVLFQKRNPEHGGNDTDYERWALQVAGVDYVKTLNAPRGLGTVDVIIGANLAIIDLVIEEVKKIVRLKEPLGVDVVVRKVSVTPQQYVIQVTGIDPDIAEQAALDYFKTVKVGSKIYNSQIQKAILLAGNEQTDAKVLQPSTDLVLASDSIVQATVVIQS